MLRGSAGHRCTRRSASQGQRLIATLSPGLAILKLLPTQRASSRNGMLPPRRTWKHWWGWLGGLVILISLARTASGLPQNFNTTQGTIPYAEITTPHFRVYFDARAPHEGLIISQSLENARPLLEKWLHISRRPQRPLRVVSSPVTEHASFANFIYDAIELQTKNQNVRDLIWHEYIHSLTYEFYRNVLGPPGTIFHIMWMPAWFLEGLAEALSVSVGSDYQAGVERWQALTNQWPTYDRLHSLYLNYTWSMRGYATAGAFVGWILKNLDSSSTATTTSLSVADLLRDFRTQTMPWHLLRNLFHPLDRTLKSRLHTSGKHLYERYKRGATAYWQVASPYPLLVASPEPRHNFPFGPLATEVQNDHLIVGNSIQRVHLSFNPKTRWATATKLLPLPKGAVGRSAIRSQDFLSYINTLPRQHHDGLVEKNAIVVGQQRSNLQVIWQGERVAKVFHTRMHLGWVVQGIASTTICTLKKSTVQAFVQQRLTSRPRPHCKPVGQAHHRIRILGSHPDPTSTFGEVLALWFGIESSALTGDSYTIKIWRAQGEQIISKPWLPLAKPISAAFTGDDIWLLTSDRSRTYLSRVTLNHACLEVIHLSDYLLGAWGMGDDRIALRLYEGHKSSFKLIIPSTLPKHPCPTPEPHSSPLLDGMRILKHHRTQADPSPDEDPTATPVPLARELAHVPTMEAVMMRTHSWRLKHYKESFYKLNHPNPPPPGMRFGALDPIRLRPYVRRYAELTTQVLPHADRHRALLGTPSFGSPRQWNPPLPTATTWRPYTHRWSSPVFFPWLGYHPIRGDQFGLISVPLIDDLQNHLIRGTVLFGMNSYFPDLNVTYYGTRYRFPISVKIFRSLLYNGWLYDPSKKQHLTHYLNEFGGLFQFHYSSPPHARLVLQYILGWKTSHLEANHTPHITSTGIKHEPYVSAQLRLKLPLNFALSLRGALMAPLGWYNSGFDYHKLRLRLGLSQRISAFNRITTLEVASSYGHTRGDPQQTLHLKELYTPILTMVTGAASTERALNRIRRPLLGNHRFLYRIYFGDTYIRNIASLSTPILHDIDKQLSIFYLKQLTFNMLVNWGQTWWAQTWGEIEAQHFRLDRSVLAYASAIDLHLENKGVNFFIGLGIGNLVGEGMLIYNQLGFTALF